MRYVLLLFLSATAGGAVLSNDHISCAITEDGIQSISLDGRVVTTTPSAEFPTHQGFYSSLRYHPNPESAIVGPILHSSLTAAPTGVTVTDTAANMAMSYAYSLDGNDINLKATLRNNDPRRYSNIMLALPTFAFSPGVTGNLKAWDPSYLVGNGEVSFHPGLWSPLAVSFARDKNYGIALHCKSDFDKPTVFDAFQVWKTPGVAPTIADVTLYLQDTIQPGDQLVIDVTIRLVSNPDLATLLASYVHDFRAFAGPMQYQPDDRPWLQFAGIDSSFVTPQDPLGYSGDLRRLDLASGISKFEDLVWPSIGVTQGTIFWQPQGYNPRGCQYRPDFDVWPASVFATLPTLIAWYKANGLKFGLCARPADIVTPMGPNADQTCTLDGQNDSQIAMLLGRFDAVTKLGVNAFYLDSFGSDLNSYHIMKRIREHLGSAIPTYSEYTNDLMLPLSGVYTELNVNPAGGQGPDGSVHWYDKDTVAAFRLLYPQCTILTKGIDSGSEPAVSPPTLAKWKMTPLVEDYQARKYRSYFQDLITNHISDNVWK